MKLIFEKSKLEKLLSSYKKAQKENPKLLTKKDKMYVQSKETLDLKIINGALVIRIISDVGEFVVETGLDTQFAGQVIDLFSAKINSLIEASKDKELPETL